MTHHIVKTMPRWWRNSLLLLLLTLFVATAWGWFEYGRYHAGFDLLTTMQRHEASQETIRALEEQVAHLRGEKAILERGSKVEREAYKQLELTINQLRGEFSEQEGQLAFYQGIVSPSSISEGLNVDEFVITAGKEPGRYVYKLVMTQVLNNSYIATGQVELLLEGEQDGVGKILNIRALSGESGSDYKFRFKYFQNIEGEMALPQGFIPGNITIRVKPAGNKYKRLEKQLEWPLKESSQHVDE